LDRDRLGIIASRRVGGAVVRNRAKRRIREIFRSTEPDRSAENGARALDVVVIARREMVAAPLAAVASEFAAVVKRLRGAR
jgi:ribonuclease P protein component